MEDESFNNNLSNGVNSESPDENPSLKTSSSSSNNNNSSSSSINNNKEQDRFLPIANVGRIMKKVMPANGKISKDAKETVQECVSEFISFVTVEASDKCQKEKRKTINGDDIIWAITILGFDDYVEPLKCYLQKYRDIEGEKLNLPKQQRSEQRLHHHHHHLQDQTNNININNNNNNLPLSSVYSSTNLISHQPSYVPSGQPYTLPFSSPSSIKQDQIDSVGHW